MRAARYSDRFFLEISDSEYIAAHRRFNEGRTERLRATISLADQAWISIQIEPPYSNSGNVFVRTNNGWSVSFGKTTAGLNNLPIFALSDVGRFDPDDTGLDLIALPGQLRAPIEKNMTAPAVGQIVLVKPKAVEEAPSEVKKVTQEEYLAKLRRAAKILNNGRDKGYIAKFDESGKIVKISTPDVEI